MGWRGVRRDIINAVKRSATASRKANARAERARLKAVRAAPPQAHYPQAQGYGPPQGQGYGPAPQGYAPYGYGPPPNPTWTAPPQKSGHSPAVILMAVIGSLFFCGTCSAVIAGTAGSSTRQASAPTRSDGRPPGAMDPVVGPDAPPLPAYVPPASTAPARAGAKPAAARPVVPTPAPRVPAAQPAPVPPGGPRCCDGSPARCTGRGCCSHHGGVCSR